MVERIIVPAASAGARGGYYKLKRIQGHDLGIVSVALLIERGGNSALDRRLLLRPDLRSSIEAALRSLPADAVVGAVLGATATIS